MNQEYAVVTKNLCKSYGDVNVLNHINLQINSGEIYGILGANGAGKTTLLKLITGFLEPTEGEVFVFNKNSWENRNDILAKIGSLIETPTFYEHLSAKDNLEIHLQYMNCNADVKDALSKVGLDGVGNKILSSFSLGMRQRLAIARSIIHNPQILLLDEPINGLDPVAIREMRELFISLKNNGMTILLSSHILNEVEQTVDRVAIISKGVLKIESNMKELIKEHNDDLENYLINIMSGRC